MRRPLSRGTARLAGVRVAVVLRRHLAAIRAAVERIDGAVTAGPHGAIDDEAIEELARVGCRAIELAALLSSERS